MDIMVDLVKNILKVGFEDLPDNIIYATKKSIIDTLGAMIAGSSVQGCKLLVEYISEFGGCEESTLAVFGGKVPSNLAALANGAMARALEIDEVTDVLPLHPTASTVPTCLAVSERGGGTTGKELITAVALGQDLVIRMALATKINPLISGRCNLFSVFASAGSAGKLLKLGQDQMLNAMGIAYSQMVGDQQAYNEGVMTCFIQQGSIAKSAIESALMAQKGITGTKNVLQGKFGFYNALEPDPDLEALTSGLGIAFMGGEISTKLYSACRGTHEAIDLALQMIKEEKIHPNSIDQIKVRVSNKIFDLLCDPLERKRHPETLGDAQFSLPYVVAVAILKGDVFIDQLTNQNIGDPDIVRLAERVTPLSDPACESDLSVGSTVMEIETEGGKRFVKKAQFPRGNPKNPVSMEICIEKFAKCVNYANRPFPKDKIDKMVQLVKELEQLNDVNELIHLLVPNP